MGAVGALCQPERVRATGAVTTVVAVGLAASLVATGCGDEPERVLDACGNDLTEIRSTVVAVDAATGATTWSTSVPLAEAYLLTDGDRPRVPLVLRTTDVVLDPATGEVVDHPAAGTHEVLVDPTGTITGSEPGSMLVDGDVQPATVTVGEVAVGTDLLAGTAGSVSLVGTDPATGTVRWSVPLGRRDELGAVGNPVVFGDDVVVVASPPKPSCP